METGPDNHESSLASPSDLMKAANCSTPGSSLPSTNDITSGCACILCFIKQEHEEAKSQRQVRKLNCVVGCALQFEWWRDVKWRNHIKTHFMQDNKYHCKAPQCGQLFIRWGELTRHYKTHCLRSEKFACDVLGCKYSGDNGFIRHDKLLSHKRNVHDGKAPPSQLMRRLQPKPRA